MDSPLSFANTDTFRKSLTKLNLVPYDKAPSDYTSNVGEEYIQSNYSVKDSPDELIDNPTFANNLYPLNQYGNDGGYEVVRDPTSLANTKTNEGEYNFQDGDIVNQSTEQSKNWKKINLYNDGTDQVIDSAVFFDSLDQPLKLGNLNNNQPYYQFTYSTYSPLSILLSDDPQGSQGLLSQDSFIARLGATNLRKDFENRIALQIQRQTIGRANILNIDGGSDVLNLATGNIPLIEPNWSITIPSNPIVAASDFALRLSGGYIPISPIPGSYWDKDTNNRTPTTIQQLKNAFNNTGVGGFFNKLVGADKTGSEIFFNNTGEGQKSRLFYNIDYNKYKPYFERDRFGSTRSTFFDGLIDNSDFYIGSKDSNPSMVFSPTGEVPVNEFGQEQQTQVYGPSELAKLYNESDPYVKTGSNGTSFSNDGGVEGGLTWVSPKYRNNAGKHVGVGGRVGNQDENFNSASFSSSESTNYDFKDGSILDKTQRIVDSQPNGGKRLKHVGNAIDQVSKVFNDGYKEMTKGSKVLKYVGEAGQEVATEYCRVFTKDTPYLTNNDLQKTDGMTTEGRKFSHSVLDKTYNLNISPNKQEGGQDSSNLIGSRESGYAKKYMFSLENLAWRTSSRSGLSISDLPMCERGPNNGRVMWFPPYDLKFSETVTANWKGQDFLGRPEPIYTYTNTQRSGQLSWKMIVDHPSALNIVVNKILSKETNRERVDSIIESFLSGCRKYDLYDLAKKYYTVNPNDLFEIQQTINQKEVSRTTIEYIVKEVQTGVDSTTSENQELTENANSYIEDLNNEYQNIGFYFDNAIPKTVGDSDSFEQEYLTYQTRINSVYSKKDTKEETNSFFESVVTPNYQKMQKLANDINNIFTNTDVSGTITIQVNSSCSAPGSVGFNQDLSERRYEIFKNFFENNINTKKLIESKKLEIIKGDIAGEVAQVEKFDPSGDRLSSDRINCSDTNPLTLDGDTVGSTEIYTTNAMACRRAVISSITGNLTQPKKELPQLNNQNIQTITEKNERVDTFIEEELVTETIPKNNITKRVLRSLLSECDYFDTIREETPMVFDNLRDKLKYFQPAFHSTTPEGLNARLTFLQQCLRPGDTIPTIKDFNGTTDLQYDNAINTAFGAPPVLILRIGDFYNTKIIPNNLSFQFEQLDINPEGIGVQPMIVDVSLSFNFVGGSGLKESISKLQNALSFNYYANTEMYDDRSDITDTQIGGKDIKVLDEEFLKSIGQTPPAPTINKTQEINGQDNNSPIGEIISKNKIENGEEGEISYSLLMDKLVQDTQNYFVTIINKNKEVSNQYNNAIRQQFMLNRDYTRGNLTSDSGNELILFGKPSKVQDRVDIIFNDYIENLNNDEDKFLEEIESYDFSPKLKKIVKENYINFIKNKRSTFNDSLNLIIQDLVKEEQKLINMLGKINVVTYEADSYRGTDGYQTKKGNLITYLLSGTTDVNKSSINASDTWDELINDVLQVKSDITNYNDAIEVSKTFSLGKKNYSGYFVFPVNYDGSLTLGEPTTNDVFIPFSYDSTFQVNLSFRRQYMIMSREILDNNNYDSFKNNILGNVINNPSIFGEGQKNIEEIFDKYWLDFAKPKFESENQLTKSFLDYVELNVLTNYTNYKPFSSKSRVFKYTSDYTISDIYKESQEYLIKGLNFSTPITTNHTTWNDLPDNSFNGVYISKPKLN